MNLMTVKTALARGLAKHENAILNHIKSVERRGRTSGIELVFSRAFESQFSNAEYKRGVPLKKVGARQFCPDTKRGFIDCYFQAAKTAFEFKAVRLPPSAPQNALFDIGQLSTDYLRLSRASRLCQGYVVIFVYGPLLPASSLSRLYQLFHNQMFVDFTIASDRGDLKPLKRKAQRKAFRELGWNAACGECKTPSYVAVVNGKIGAICIDCRD